MNLFEYQGKELYKKYGIDTPNSFFVSELENLKNHNLNFPLVVKSQVQVGGRGKAGGIKVAKNSPMKTREVLINVSTNITSNES